MQLILGNLTIEINKILSTPAVNEMVEVHKALSLFKDSDEEMKQKILHDINYFGPINGERLCGRFELEQIFDRLPALIAEMKLSITQSKQTQL